MAHLAGPQYVMLLSIIYVRLLHHLAIMKVQSLLEAIPFTWSQPHLITDNSRVTL